MRVTVVSVSPELGPGVETLTTTIYYDVAQSRYFTLCHVEAISAPDHGSSSLNCLGQLDLSNPTDLRLFVSTVWRWVTQVVGRTAIT